MKLTYDPLKNDKERQAEALERGLLDYLRLFVVASLIIGLFALASGQIGKAVDQDLGIYKANQAK